MPEHILIVEDEPSIAQTVEYALRTEGFRATWVTLGAEALGHMQRAAEDGGADLVILDVGLPDMGGFEVLKELRTFSEAPVIFLTARKDEIDRVVGLEIGADDYVVKPFSPRELVARVKVILRRRTGSNTSAPSIAGPFEINTDTQRITYQGTQLDLTRYEYRLLAELIAAPGRIFSRDQLMDRVWDEPGMSTDRTVDAHIKQLRAKLRAIDAGADPIKTHRGMGYSLEMA